MNTNASSIAAPAPTKAKTTRAPHSGEPVSQQPQAIQMNAMKPSMSKTSAHVEQVQRLRGGGAGKDCLIGMFGCFICFECCEGCCDCCADIICCPCEMCC